MTAADQRLPTLGEASNLVDAFLFLAAAELLLRRNELLFEAIRIEQRNPPWARNRRRKAAVLLAKARRMCGERGLSWGTPD